MCGLVGVISIDGFSGAGRRTKFFSEAMWVGSVRGYDSTGMMYVDRDKEVSTYKHVLSGPDFLAQKPVARVLKDIEQYPILIGHHRFKTTGNIDRRAAHPHSYGPITLVHNGNIENSYQLPGYKYDKDSPDVDTYRLTEAMGKEGAKKILPIARGAYALIWWDADEEALFIARNAARPLSFCWEKGKKSLYIASEWLMLNWLMTRNNIEREGKGTEVAEHTLYRFDVNKNSISITKTPYEVKKEETKYYYGSRRSGMENWPHDTRQSVGPVHSTSQKPQQQAPASEPKSTTVATAVGTVTTLPVPVRYRPSDEAHNSKHAERVNRILRDIGIVYDASIWAIPDKWVPYRNRDDRGIAEFFQLRREDKHPAADKKIMVYDMDKSSWNAIIGMGLFTSIIVKDVTHGEQTIIGKINWTKQGESWQFAKSIPDNDDVIQFIPKGLGEFLTKKQFMEAIRHGCGLCKQPIKLEDADELDWIEDAPICKTCTSGLN